MRSAESRSPSALNRRLWQPFYALLEQLKRYRLNRNEAIMLPATSVLEFQELQEAVQLLLRRATSVRRLLLVGAERPEPAVRGEDIFHDLDAQRTDELVLEVRLANVEPEPLEVGSGAHGTVGRALERTT